MSSLRAILCFLFGALLACVPASAATTTRHHHAVSSHVSTHRVSSHHSRRHAHRIHGQEAIEPERVTQIQTALVHAHYLSEEPNGDWDSATQVAMQKYQADHGWQTKLMPDSRALKALGLGPDYSTAINAKEVASSNAGTGQAPGVPAAEAAGFTASSGVNR